MRYEHLVEVNDPLNPLLDPLTREQIWNGLVLRAEEPARFQEQVESSAILERGEGYLEREVYLGNLRVRDRIRFDPMSTVHYQTQPGENHGGGSLTMTIEEPAPGHLFVRFLYQTALSEVTHYETDAGDAYFAPYVKAAYEQADIETIRRIREFADAGLLG